MTIRYASGKHALGECDLCGLAFPYNTLRPVVENQILTGLKACSDCWTPDHPQWQAGKNVVADAEMLRDPRPDRRPADLTNIRWGWNPVFGIEVKASLGDVLVDIRSAA